MAFSAHRSPSIGGLVQRLLEHHPHLNTTELIMIVKQATERRGKESGEFAGTEYINEERAIELVRALAEQSQLH